MAWIFVSKAKMNYFVNGDSSTVIKNAILDSLVLQSDALDSWNQNSMNINISTDKVISYGNIVARRNGIVQTRASSNGAVSYGVDNEFWLHFYNERNNWYYRAFTGTVSGSEYIDYTQLTQSYDIAIYSGFAINESLHRAALLTLTVDEPNNSKIELNAYFKRPSISFDDFYTEIKSVIPTYTSNGGESTHIAKLTGQLRDLSSNLSAILMVSGGGGGGLVSGDTDYSGKEAGGISGSGDNSADQTTGYAFGQGEIGAGASGGGSGLYGGYKGTSSKSGGAGSGYIGNSLVSNKKMVGFNVPTSSAEATKTESVNDVSASAVSGKPKSGNGFAKIKFLRDWESIEPVVPSEYRDYVQIINGRRQSDTFYGLRDFFWCDYVHYSHVFYYFDGSASEHSFFLWGGMPNIQHFGNMGYNHVDMISTIDSTGQRKFEEAYNSVCCAPITDIRISGSGNSYSFTTDLDGKLQALFVNDRLGGDYHHYAGAWNRNLETGEINIGCNTNASSSDYTDFTFTGTLEDVFKLLAMWCRNVNIYVNNECWSNVE